MIENAFNIGDMVYLKTDRDQYERMIIGIFISPVGISYRCAAGNLETNHYEIELAKEKNVMITTTN